MKSIYEVPIVEEIRLEYSILLQDSRPVIPKKQCDCSQHRLYGGCDGCEGNCGCGEC